jgi:hypothetical protein
MEDGGVGVLRAEKDFGRVFVVDILMRCETMDEKP